MADLRNPRRLPPHPPPRTRVINMREMRQNEPLVPMSRTVNSLSVSSVVNTKAFRDAFEEMPLSRQVSNSLYGQAGRILRAANGTEFEYMAAVDARTGALVADNLGRRPGRKRTGFSPSEMGKIRKCCAGVITIHNHPGGFPPSYRDLFTASSYSFVKGSVVVGHDGSVWFIAVESEVVVDMLAERYNSLKETYADFAEIKAAEWLIEQNKLHRLFEFRRLR